MSSPVRVLHVLGRLEGGGIQHAVLNLIRFFPRGEYHFDICEMAENPGPLAKIAESMGCRVYQCPLGNNWRKFANRFAGILRAGHYDIVHVNRSSATVFAPLRVAGTCAVPVRVAQLQNIRRRQPLSPRRIAEGMMHRLWNHHATDIIGITDEVLASHFGDAWRNDPRIQQIPNGIDIHHYTSLDREKARAELSIPADAVVVGNTSRFSEAKNHRAIIECAALLCDKHPALLFLLPGDGPLLPRMQAMARERGLSDRILFTGWQDDVRASLAAMDIFLFPSHWEGQGISLVEAQAAGLPCLASPLRCFEGVLAPRLEAFRVPTNDFSTTAQTLEKLIADEALRRELGAAARAHAPIFDIRRIVEKVDSLYRARLIGR